MFAVINKIQPLRPITSFVEMFCADGVFRIGTTDGSSKLVATLLDTDDMDNIVLDREQLLKILKLTNKEDIKFIRKDKYVAFKGCGNYKLPIQCDETGYSQATLQFFVSPGSGGTGQSISKAEFESNK